MRLVAFTPEEMVAEVPANTSGYKTLTRGKAEWEAFLSFSRGYVRLDPDLRASFRDDRAVNDLLRKALELARAANAKPKKSA